MIDSIEAELRWLENRADLLPSPPLSVSDVVVLRKADQRLHDLVTPLVCQRMRIEGSLGLNPNKPFLHTVIQLAIQGIRHPYLFLEKLLVDGQLDSIHAQQAAIHLRLGLPRNTQEAAIDNLAGF